MIRLSGCLLAAETSGSGCHFHAALNNYGAASPDLAQQPAAGVVRLSGQHVPQRGLALR